MKKTISAAVDQCRCSPRYLKPGELQELLWQLGSLAPWWLLPELLHRAAQELGHASGPVRLPTAPGSCWIVFAQEQPTDFPSLRPAFVLPVQWQQGRAHSQHLPSKLQQLAASVTRLLDLPGWGLALNRALGKIYPCLHELNPLFEMQSGWVALAGGLLVAAEGGKPDPAVWASGRADSTGQIGLIGHLPAKICLAAEYGAHHFFVPASQVEEASRIVRENGLEGLQIGLLEEHHSQVRKALRHYLRWLEVPPSRDDAREDRCEYYLRQTDEGWARTYYQDNLLPDIVAGLIPQWSHFAAADKTRAVVSIASDNPELIAMAVGVVRPAVCLILYTKDKKSRFEEAVRLCTEYQPRCQIHSHQFLDLPQLVAGMTEIIREFVARTQAEQLVLDLTPGNKEMSLTMALETAHPGDYLYYVRHERQGPKVIPFTEQLLVRQPSTANA